MLNIIRSALFSLPSIPSIVVSVALMLFIGFLVTRLTKLVKLPNVTAYILTGILLGPFCLNFIPETVITGMDFISDIALAFIAFSAGEFFKLSTLKKNGSKTIVITIFESFTASIVVFIVCFLFLHLNLAFSIVLAALAAATAPASTMMTIRQTGAKGDFVDTLLQVVALDDVVGLLLYAIAISIATATISGKVTAGNILKPLIINIVTFALGAGCGVLMKTMMPKKRSKDNKLIISIAIIFLFCGICEILNASPLLGCMAMGMVYTNIAEDEKLFKQLGYFSPPILLLFFVHSGLSFRLDSLFSSSFIGTVPLIVVGVIYFVVRILGKYGGSYAGCLLTKKDKSVRNYLGLALIPQAGVAIGLAELGARALGGEMGTALHTIILSSSVLYELIGPACAKLSLYLSGSYSSKLEDIAPVEESEKKSEVDVLIERIHKIQEELPKREKNEEEEAFTEAAEEYRENIRAPYNIKKGE